MILQRAKKKLQLDALVIQSGRLAQKHKALSKEEILGMIKFGAQEIFKKSDANDITEADIDAIIARGQSKVTKADYYFFLARGGEMASHIAASHQAPCCFSATSPCPRTLPHVVYN